MPSEYPNISSSEVLTNFQWISVDNAQQSKNGCLNHSHAIQSSINESFFEQLEGIENDYVEKSVDLSRQ